MMEIRAVSLKNYSSLKIGGEGNIVTVSSLAELVEALMYAKEKELRVHVIGEGTNTFFGENFENMLFIKIAIKGISFEERGDEYLVKIAAGENWDDIVKLAVEKGLWGIENLSSIPGSVGAAPIQNIGAYGTELEHTLLSLEAIDTTTLNLVEISNAGCGFGYRHSMFKEEKGKYIIVSVTLKLSQAPRPILTYKPLDALVLKEHVVLQEIRDCVVAIRKEKLPDYNQFPNTGSFFKNPIISQEEGDALALKFPDIKLIPYQDGYKIPAAWLIEYVAEYKGIREGNIGTWPSQPLVLINYGDANAQELLDFSEKIIAIVKEKTDVTLEREVNCIV